MEKHSKPLTTAEQIQELVLVLKQQDMIAFDTEFIRETTYFPRLEVIQIATDQESWIVDVQAFSPDRKKGLAFLRYNQNLQVPEGLLPLIEVFEDPKILKILHAAQGDQECLFTSLGVTAHPTLDTAMAASVCGYGDGVGLGNLLKQVLNIKIKKGHARTDWSVRPLPPQQIEYAHQDVVYLVEAAQKLLARLDKLGRKKWALALSSESENPSNYGLQFDEIWKKLSKSGRVEESMYPALYELIRWRENRIRQLDVPRKWVADDGVLMDLARVKPKDLKHLMTFRGLNRGEAKKSGEYLVKLIQSATAESVDFPKIARAKVKAPSQEESRGVEILRCFIGILADRNRVALKHLMDSNQLLPLLRADLQSPADLVSGGYLRPHSADLVGEDIFLFLQGKKSISLERSGGDGIVKID